MGFYAFDGECYECNEDHTIDLPNGLQVILLGDENALNCVECPESVLENEIFSHKTLNEEDEEEEEIEEVRISISTICVENYYLNPSKTLCVAELEDCDFDYPDWYDRDDDYYCQQCSDEDSTWDFTQ